MMRYEASLDGIPVEGEPFTDFNEVQVLADVFTALGWRYEMTPIGRGGYYRYEVEQENGKKLTLRIYLKRITFGGRESRPYEKRAQFSAALERDGFDAPQTENELSLILGIYKSDTFPDIVICAWDIHDWGYNVGRAFNCFVDVAKIALALKKSTIVQHRSSIGQIACCFRPELLPYYLSHKEQLHQVYNESGLQEPSGHNDHADTNLLDYNDEIPRYSSLFQLTADILKDHDGIASLDTIETEAGDRLKLTDAAKMRIHNTEEGYRTELGYQLAWARFYLKKAGLIENPARSIWSLTELGYNTNAPIDANSVIKAATKKEIEEEIAKDTQLNIDAENDIENESDLDSALIENPFDPNLVDIRTRTMSLDLILKRLRNNAVDMNTSFQRKANLWNITKQSRLIESILVRFPLPAFYFDGSNDDNWLVVDGLQRLSSLDNYVNHEKFGLKGLEFLSQFNDKKFSELPAYLQRRIEEFEITAYIIASGTPKVLKFNVFKRINTGGLTLTPQEIRNALNQGKPSRFIKQLADLRSFKMATCYTIPEDRMMDQEFVARFLAFYLLDIDRDYNADLDSFLNKAMELLYGEVGAEKVKADFNKAMSAAMSIFGNDAFRKRFDRGHKRKPINKALFEVWSVLLSRQSDQSIARLVARKETLIDAFMTLLNTDEGFNKAITSGTGDKARIKKRFAEISNIISQVL